MAIKTETYFKICDDRDGQPTTLFHGIAGSRAMQLDRWMQADKKLVNDGTSSTYYMSGFHVCKKLKHLQAYAKKFKNKEGRVICKVDVDTSDIWPKDHSKHPIILASRMRIRKTYWEKRIGI